MFCTIYFAVEALLKKVDLGVEDFDKLMDNHKHASQPNQREKYEELLGFRF